MFYPPFSSNLLTILSVAVLALFSTGCGNGNDNNSQFADTGQGAQTASQGSLTFRFAASQATTVPTGTGTLRFDVYNGEGGTGSLIFTQTEAFAIQVTLVNVPTSAKSVVITSSNTEGFPTGTQALNVVTTANTNTDVDLTGSTFTPVTVTQLSVSPDPLSIDVGGIGSYSVSANFSNSAVAPLPTSSLTFTLADKTLATVEDGIFKGVAAGTTSVKITFSHNGAETSVNGNLTVSVE